MTDKQAKPSFKVPGHYSVTAAEVVTLEKNQCKWPEGNPKGDGFSFCSSERLPGRPYCMEHFKKSRNSASRTVAEKLNWAMQNPYEPAARNILAAAKEGGLRKVAPA